MHKAARKDWEAKSPLSSRGTRRDDDGRWWEAGIGDESEEVQMEAGEPPSERKGILALAAPAPASSCVLVASEVSEEAKKRE